MVEMKNPVIGEVFTFTHVEYPGHGIEISFPYYQIDVKLPKVCTTMKGYLVKGEAKIGMKVEGHVQTVEGARRAIDAGAGFSPARPRLAASFCSNIWIGSYKIRLYFIRRKTN
mgnify:CR=1 FL=1